MDDLWMEVVSAIVHGSYSRAHEDRLGKIVTCP
jgi:hypothetical protein